MRSSRIHVRGLPLPVLLVESIASGDWPPRDGTRLRTVIPWFEDPADLLADVEEMHRESAHRIGGATSGLLRQARGSQSTDLVELPWLDTDLAVIIGVGRASEDGGALALDYRTGSDDPRVVACDRRSDPHRYTWRVAAPAFSAFAAALGIGARRLYRYVGPDEIYAQIWSGGKRKRTSHHLARRADRVARPAGRRRTRRAVHVRRRPVRDPAAGSAAQRTRRLRGRRPGAERRGDHLRTER